MWQRSENYVWSTEKLLGRGAFGCVYEASNKTTGELVAVKTFKTVSSRYQVDIDRYLQLQKHEFSILQKVNHENVIRLIAIEKNDEEDELVIIMQLCTGGSLSDVIDHPENLYGLDENEFLIVLNHITAGMKYLRGQNLVHRDLKPGNILRFVCDDGRIVYKLGDFGAARELDDNEVFQSIYGTEEYLRPDIFEAAFLKYNSNCFFGATVDLWSIGVTLYQIAAGHLPFQAYKRRQDRPTMFKLISTKRSGVISGIQKKKDGPIEYSKHLPGTCQLSFSLKILITSLIAGLLETDKAKFWDYNRYFNGVDNILSRRIINVFFMNQCRIIKIYLHPDEDYRNFQSYIHEQTGILSKNQVLLSNQSNLIVNLQSLNRTDKDDVLYLFDRTKNEAVASINIDLPEFGGFFHTIEIHKIYDKRQAKTACSIGYMCKRYIEEFSSNYQHFINIEIKFKQFIVKQLKELLQTSRFLLDKCIIIKQITPIISAFQQNTDLLDDLKLNDSNFRSLFIQLNQLYENCVDGDVLTAKWCDLFENLRTYRAIKKATTAVERLEQSWKFFKSYDDNDPQSYVLERARVIDTLNNIKDLLQHVCQEYRQSTGIFNDWYQNFKHHLFDTMVIKRRVIEFRDEIKLIETAIKDKDYLGSLQRFIQMHDNPNWNRRRLDQLLAQCNNNQYRILEIVRENHFLTAEINGILRQNNVQPHVVLEIDSDTVPARAQDILNEHFNLIPELEDVMAQAEHSISTIIDDLQV